MFLFNRPKQTRTVPKRIGTGPRRCAASVMAATSDSIVTATRDLRRRRLPSCPRRIARRHGRRRNYTDRPHYVHPLEVLHESHVGCRGLRSCKVRPRNLIDRLPLRLTLRPPSRCPIANRLTGQAGHKLSSRGLQSGFHGHHHRSRGGAQSLPLRGRESDLFPPEPKHRRLVQKLRDLGIRCFDSGSRDLRQGSPARLIARRSLHLEARRFFVGPFRGFSRWCNLRLRLCRRHPPGSRAGLPAKLRLRRRQPYDVMRAQGRTLRRLPVDSGSVRTWRRGD